MSQHSSWVVEFSLEIHASVSLHMHIGNAMLHNSSLAPWVNPSILFVCSLSSHSLDCISCSHKEMCDAPIGTTSWSPAVKWNGLKKLTYSGGRGGIVTIWTSEDSPVIKYSYCINRLTHFCIKIFFFIIPGVFLISVNSSNSKWLRRMS